MPVSLRAHLQRITAGDPEAAAWLYDTFAPSLLARLRRRYGRTPGIVVEDLLHDAFVFFFGRQAQILKRFLDKVPEERHTEDSLAAYLWDQACGLASTQRRSAVRRPPHRSLSELGAVGAAAPAGERGTVARDTLARLDACLRRAGPRVYLYFKLRYRDQLTPDEIARATGWSKKATYKLRQRLTAAGGGRSSAAGLPRRLRAVRLPIVLRGLGRGRARVADPHRR